MSRKKLRVFKAEQNCFSQSDAVVVSAKKARPGAGSRAGRGYGGLAG